MRMGKGRQRCDKFVCTWSHKSKALYRQRPERRLELLLDTNEPLIALYIAIGCLDGNCAYFLVVKPGRKYALIPNMRLNPGCA